MQQVSQMYLFVSWPKYCHPISCSMHASHNQPIFIYLFQQDQQDATFQIIFIIINALHVSGGSSPHYQELKCV